jgi:methylmalonyl-CoA mutase N-terminal domain/subunit
MQIPILEMDPKGYDVQCARLEEVRATRDNEKVGQRLATLKTAAQGTQNLMPYIIDAVQAYATMQDIMDVFREVFGEYEEMTII